MNHKTGTREEWLTARKALLVKEMELTHARDALAAERRALPWVKIEKNYVFDSAQGKVSLAELFENRSQLMIYHFMFGPDWEAGCPGCSFLSDHVDAARQHFEHNDLSFAAVARTSVDKIEAYKKRMGWTFRWVSSLNSDFNYDFNVSWAKEQIEAGPVEYNFRQQKVTMQDLHGESMFYKDADGTIYHTYSSYERAAKRSPTPTASWISHLSAATKGRTATWENGCSGTTNTAAETAARVRQRERPATPAGLLFCPSSA